MHGGSKLKSMLTPEDKPKPPQPGFVPVPLVFPSLPTALCLHLHTLGEPGQLALAPLPVLLRSFTETMSSLSPGKPWQTKLSSAGLIYLHFGHKLLAQLLGASEEDGMVGTLYDKVGTRGQRCPPRASPPRGPERHSRPRSGQSS